MGLSYFFLTELKGVHTPISEKIAQFSFAPMRYFLNGKKVEVIKDDGNIAVQIVNSSATKSDLKSAFMVIALLPGLIIGAIFKAYAMLVHHSRKDDEFIRKSIAKFQPGNSTVFTPKGQGELAERLSGLIRVVTERVFPKADIVIFSEVEALHLCSITLPNNEFSSDQIQRCNRIIFNNIHLFSNLKRFYVYDYYDRFRPSEREIQVLKNVNPFITFRRFDDQFATMKARDYFKK